jgi:hypothetical protein
MICRTGSEKPPVGRTTARTSRHKIHFEFGNSSIHQMVQQPKNAADDKSEERSAIVSSSLLLPSGQIIDAKNTLRSFRPGNVSAIHVDCAFDESGDGDRGQVALGSSRPIFQSGHLIDSKNTLQSFHFANRNEAIHRSISNSNSSGIAASFMGRDPAVLPSGDIIDAKNINQSFRLPRSDVISTRNPTVRASESNRVENLASNASVAYNVEAFAVQSLPFVVAEVLNHEQQPSQDHQRRRCALFWPIICAVVVIVSATVASITVYCGLGNCSSSNGVSMKDTSMLGEPQTPTVPAPFTVTSPNTQPSMAPTNSFHIIPMTAPILQPSAAFPVPMNPPQPIPSASVSPLPSMEPRKTSINAPAVGSPKDSIAVAFINNITLSGRTLEVNGTTPEDAALTWMIENDSLLQNTSSQVKLNSHAKNEVGFRVQQRYALLTLWFQQLGIDGLFMASWTNTSSWLVDDDECNWFAITCESIDQGGNIGTQNVVIELNFHNDPYTGNNVSGTLSPDLGLLSMLQVADFRYNILAGTFPEALSLWTQLVLFAAPYNALSGLLPEFMGRWTALSYLDVSYNMLMGTLPIAQGQWQKMKSFLVRGNDLSGSLPEWIGDWTSLIQFGVEACTLTGTLPESIGQWTSLNEFGASFNNLVGSLPQSIGQWSDITYVDLAYNQINGTLPTSIQNWTKLEVISLAHNSLSGILIEAFGRWTEITDIDVSVNALTGVLPSSIGQWSLLDFFNVSENGFIGTIPSSIGNWTLIQFAYFNENQFTGAFPIDICKIRQANLNVDLVADCSPEIECSCCNNVCT